MPIIEGENAPTCHSCGKIALPCRCTLSTTFFQPLSAEWTKISNSAQLDGTDVKLYVAAGVRAPQKDQVVEVDDVQVWKSTSGRCDER